MDAAAPLRFQVMKLPEAVGVLRRTPGVVAGMLSALPDEWATDSDGPGSWSAFDIVAHLIEGERTDWIPRTRIILEHGPAQPFEPFDRTNVPDAPSTMTERLREFVRLRDANLTTLDQLAIDEADMQRRGMHPELGEVTLGQLIATWAAHDLSHIAQIAETLARHYRDDVGPWRKLLPALDLGSGAH